jgi:hypothetical protein
MTQLYYNEDSTDFFYHGDHTGGRGGANLDAFVDRIASAGVTTYLCNTNASRANYDSAVWTSTWEGFDPQGPDHQPYLAGLAADGQPVDVSGWRRLVTNTLALHEQGIDYPAHTIERCRLRGMSPWITLRMNDVHEQINTKHPIHGHFWRDNPHLWRRNSDSYFGRAFEFSHVEVRDYYLALVDETLERYDVDGLELDFLREPFLFTVGEEDSGRELLSEWVGVVRQRIDAAAERRGHIIQLGVRSPSKPCVAHAFGMDPLRWVRAGWLDLLVVSPRWSTIEFAMPLREWREQLGGCSAVLAGGLEILRGDHAMGPKRPVTAAEARGAAAQVLHDGADAVYLFNYFPSADATTMPDAWARDAYEQTIASVASLERIGPLTRTHAITFADMIGPEGAVPDPPPQLPVEGVDLSFELPTGPRPVRGDGELVIGLSSKGEAPLAYVNDGGPLVMVSSAATGQLCHNHYALPIELLVDDGQQNQIHLICQDSLRVESVEIRILPTGTRIA